MPLATLLVPVVHLHDVAEGAVCDSLHAVVDLEEQDVLLDVGRKQRERQKLGDART
jgi:hypothetical protein